MIEDSSETANYTNIKNSVFGFKKLFKILLGLFVLLVVIIIFGFNYLKQPPDNFPVNTIITVPAGATVLDVSELVKQKGLVKSEWLFYVYFKLKADESVSLKASDYFFTEPLTVPDLIEELIRGHYDQGLQKLTHIEGDRIENFAKEAKAVLEDFDEELFVSLAKPREGRLFPDTYMVPSDYSEEELVDLMLETFTEKIEPLQESITEHELSLDEIIILASILEREANSVESMKMVSGILQNRLAIGMALQVDASLEYILDKPLAELVPEDLKIESPYNTYLNQGLTPTPIGNPGLEAIKAVLEPTASDYLFYITGDDGNFYYAKDFDQHRINVSRYLR